MKSLYESILSSTGSGAVSAYKKALSEYKGGGRRLEIDVPFDYFCNRITLEEFKKICDYSLTKVRKERQTRHGYSSSIEQFLNIVLSNGTITFRFMKDRGFISWRALYLSTPIISYWGCPEAFDNANKNGMSSYGQPITMKPDQQLKFWFSIFKEKIDALKNSYTEVKKK